MVFGGRVEGGAKPPSRKRRPCFSVPPLISRCSTPSVGCQHDAACICSCCAPCCWQPAPAIGRYLLPARRSAANPLHAAAAVDRWDRQTDRHTDKRSTTGDAYCRANSLPIRRVLFTQIYMNAVCAWVIPFRKDS